MWSIRSCISRLLSNNTPKYKYVVTGVTLSPFNWHSTDIPEWFVPMYINMHFLCSPLIYSLITSKSHWANHAEVQVAYFNLFCPRWIQSSIIQHGYCCSPGIIVKVINKYFIENAFQYGSLRYPSLLHAYSWNYVPTLLWMCTKYKIAIRPANMS